jgi:hypothetical protein
VAGLVYVFIRASQHGWRDTIAIISFAAAAALLLAFVAIERRTARPITPLRLFASRNRSGIYVMALALTGSLTGLFFFLTVFLQDALARYVSSGRSTISGAAGVLITAPRRCKPPASPLARPRPAVACCQRTATRSRLTSKSRSDGPHQNRL